MSITVLLVLSIAQTGLLAGSGEVTTDSWKPPIGIPVPSFGINETYRMYDDQAKRNPALVYQESAGGGYFTHYVDVNASNATDSYNAFGSIAKPRLTVPTNLPAGSVIEIHNGANATGSGWFNVTGLGTATMPIFVRGVDKPRISSWLNIGFKGMTQYVIVEGIHFVSGQVSGCATGVFNTSYIGLRNCEFQGNGVDNGARVATYSNVAGNYVTNVVIYNCISWDGGNWTERLADTDKGGFEPSNYSNYIWVVDCVAYHNSCNGLQICVAPQSNDPNRADTPHHIYVGRNVFYENKQPGFWTKTARDVIFSQNVTFGHKYDTAYGTFGAGFGSQYAPQRVWYLFNISYDNHYGMKFSSTDGPRQEEYVIGNRFYNCHGFKYDRTTGTYIEEDGAGIMLDAYSQTTGFTLRPQFLLNTIYNTRAGIQTDRHCKFDAYNNVIAKYKYATQINSTYNTISNSSFDYSILDASGQIMWGSTYANLKALMTGTAQGHNSIEADPMFVDAENGDFSLQDSSPVKTMATSPKVQIVFDRFKELYGIDLNEDINGVPRSYVPPTTKVSESSGAVTPPAVTDNTSVSGETATQTSGTESTSVPTNTNTTSGTESTSVPTNTNTTSGTQETGTAATNSAQTSTSSGSTSTQTAQQGTTATSGTTSGSKKIITGFSSKKASMRNIFDNYEQLYNQDNRRRTNREYNE